jgi:hypothetical protein
MRRPLFEIIKNFIHSQSLAMDPVIKAFENDLMLVFKKNITSSLLRISIQ